MGTYNGQAFLAEQLLSIENQSHKNWRLVMRDDGSTDDTLAIAKTFQEKWGKDRLEIRKGPKQGFCANFLSLACDQTIKADFYAFADQDDIWMVDKLSIALAYFNTENTVDIPRVYCGRTQIVDEDLNHLGYSSLFALPLSFRNALVQSIAGANTMVFNQGAKELLEKAGLLRVVSHDWWLYQVTQGVGGKVYYDPNPTLLYRQHSEILAGSSIHLTQKLQRIMRLFKGEFKKWNIVNYNALCKVSDLFTHENQLLLASYGHFRTANFIRRYLLFKVCGLYRQTLAGNIALWVAVLINKV